MLFKIEQTKLKSDWKLRKAMGSNGSVQWGTLHKTYEKKLLQGKICSLKGEMRLIKRNKSQFIATYSIIIKTFY